VHSDICPGSGAGSPVFCASQAMGGGKTHSMIALGFWRRIQTCAIGFLKRRIGPQFLGNAVSADSREKIPTPRAAMGSTARSLIKGRNLLPTFPLSSVLLALRHGKCSLPVRLSSLLDELSPYLEYADRCPCWKCGSQRGHNGSSCQSVHAVRAMDKTFCLVLSDLAGTNFSVGQERIKPP